jgi:hypothetical protein
MALLALAAALLAALVRALKEDVQAFPTLSPSARGAVVALGGALIAGVDAIENGTPGIPAVLTALATAAPAFVTLLIGLGSPKAPPPSTGTNGSGGASPAMPTTTDLGGGQHPMVARMLGGVAFAVFVVVMIPGCKGGLPATVHDIDEAQTFIADANNVISAIETAAKVFFLASPSVPLEIKVNKAIETAKLGVTIAIRSLAGAKEVTQAQLDGAFADFRAAYADLIELVTALGIAHELPTSGPAIGAAPGVGVPRPLALRGQ